MQGCARSSTERRTIFVRKSHTMSSKSSTDSGSGVRTSPNPYIIIATVHTGSEVVGGASGRIAVYVPVKRHSPKGSGAQRHSAWGVGAFYIAPPYANLHKPKPHSPSFSKGLLTLLSTSRINPRCPCGAPRPCGACRPDMQLN